MIGGRSHYFITVYAPKGTKISFPEFNNKKEIVSDVEILSAKSDTADANGKVRIRRIYTITAWDAKRYTIPAQKVIVGGTTKTTGNVALDVQAVPIDTVKSTPMPPDDIQKVPFSWGEWVPVILVIVLALILICIVFYLYRILCHKKKVRTPKNTRVLSYYEQAKHDLSEIAANKMLYAEQKAYYTDVTNVLTADLVKFAKYSTDANDMTYYLDSIVHFIDSTKVEEPKEVIEEPKENISDTRSRKTIKLAIGLLLVTSVALLIYAAFEAYALLM